MRVLLFIIGLLLLPCLHAQDIRFASTPEDAMSDHAEQVPPLYGHCTDSLRIDSVYMEDISSGELVLQVQTYPLARYEFYTDGALYRRIDLSPATEQVDTLVIEDPLTGELFVTVKGIRGDIPNGAYHEFFPNGNIRIKGTLDGYTPDGTLKKTGEWTEWDESGKVVRRETYP